jgi:hypothetical protein
VPNPFDNRDSLSRTIWKKRATGYIFVSVPELSDAHPLSFDVVRARYPSTLKMTSTGNGWTQLEFVLQPDMGGSLPLWLMRSLMGSNLAWVTEIQHYFGELRGHEDWDADDGEAIGEVLVTRSDAEKHHGKGETRVEARVRELVKKQKGLKELGDKHDWFKVLLTKIVENKLRPAGDSKTKLCNMSEKEANVIGRALASCIAANLTAPAAVDEWMLRYPAMGELEREYVRERSKRQHEIAAAARQRPTPMTARSKRAGRAGDNKLLLLRSFVRPSHSHNSPSLAPLIPPPPPGTRGSGPWWTRSRSGSWRASAGASSCGSIRAPALARWNCSRTCT